ncbi:MAG: hypothetical protein AAGH79_00010 [Bacteroidota bacterium]
MKDLRFIGGLFLIFCLFLNTNLAAQGGFPESWAGKWAGTLEIYNAKGLAQSLPMQLHILPIDSTNRYSWGIIYGEDIEKGLRDYELMPVDTSLGHYQVDEKNGIILDAYLLGDKLFERFEVMGNLLLTTTELRGENLYWEIISGSLEPIVTTGGGEYEGEEIPPVGGYSIVVLQRAVLSRIE